MTELSHVSLSNAVQHPTSSPPLSASWTSLLEGHGTAYSVVREMFLAVIAMISITHFSVTFGVQALNRKILRLLLIARRYRVVKIIPMIDHSL